MSLHAHGQARRVALMAAVETEWQFDAVHLAAVRRWLARPAEGPLHVVPGRTQSQVDTYLDTPDLRIHRAGRSLRLRRVGRIAESTLKSLASAVGGMRAREEITEGLSAPDLAALAQGEGEVGWRVRALAGTHPLVPLFEVRTRRQVFSLELNGAPAGEVALDRTVIVADAGSEPAHLQRVEVEVEDASGPEVAGFVERLRNECALQPARLTKYEAGLLALGREIPSEPDLGNRSFDRGSSTGELAFAVLRGSFAQMLAHEAGTRLGEDAEELHDMRVATRRIRAVLGMFEGALPVRSTRFRAEFGWLGQLLGAVRDLDVADLSFKNQAGLEHLLEGRRAVARSALLEALDSRRYQRLVDGFTAFLLRGPLRRSHASTAPAVAVVPVIVAERYRKVRKAGRRLGAGSEPCEFHALRIQCKRFRYALEAVSGLYGKPVRASVRRLVAIQDVLGSHQDSCVGIVHLRSLAFEEGLDLPPEAVFAMGGLAERHARQAEQLRARFPRVFKDLEGPWKDLRRAMERAIPRAAPARTTRTARASRSVAPPAVDVGQLIEAAGALEPFRPGAAGPGQAPVLTDL